MLSWLLFGGIVEEEAAGGAEGHDTGLDAGQIAVVTGGVVIHEPELVLVARQERGVLLQRREVLPQPEPAAPLFGHAAAGRRRLVLVGEPRVQLAAEVAREQYDRVEAAGRGLVRLRRRRRRAGGDEEHGGKQENEGRRQALLLRLHLGPLNLLATASAFGDG